MADRDKSIPVLCLLFSIFVTTSLLCVGVQHYLKAVEVECNSNIQKIYDILLPAAGWCWAQADKNTARFGPKIVQNPPHCPRPLALTLL